MSFGEALVAFIVSFLTLFEYIGAAVVVVGFIWLFCEFVRVSNPSAPL